LNWALAVGGVALSKAVWDEIVEVLNRPRLSRSIVPTDREDVLATLSQKGIWFEPTEAVAECRDPKDDKYLELALAASATAIVTSDNDLRVMHPWRGIAILRPAEFLSPM
jgi:putative PIN family toxin of toxin-antitoxin system